MPVACAMVVLCAGAVTQALDPERSIAQYLQDRWGSGQGFPGGAVHGITQGEAGYLWIAAERGLVRFDGLVFRLFQPSARTVGTGPTVLGVVPDPDFGVWTRLRGPALMRHRNKTFDDMWANAARPDSVVTAMVQTDDDAILLATLGQGALAYRRGAFESIITSEEMGRSFAIAITQTSDGAVWLGTRDAGLIRVHSGHVTPIADGLPEPKVNCLLAGRDGDLWIGTDRGVVRWQQGKITTSGVPPELTSLPTLAMLRDRESNLWLAAGARGLVRVTSRGVSTFGRSEGLTGNVSAVFEDREGNLWVGTNTGLARLRDGVFTTFSTSQGLPADSVGPIYIDADQRTWFAPSDGGLYWWRDGVVTRVTEAGLANDIVYSIDGAAGDVWVGRQRGGLTKIRVQDSAVVAERYTQSTGLAQDNVFAVYRARDGAVWAGTLSGGVSRLKDGTFTTYTTSDGLASNTVASIVESADGTMWFATPNGISTLSRGGWRRFTRTEGLPSNDVNVLMADSRGVIWAGTASGLARFEGGRPRVPETRRTELGGSIVGMAEDRLGYFWITTVDSVLRVNRDALLYGVLGEGDLREFAIADGLLALEGVKRNRSAAVDRRGRVWLSLARGLSLVQPESVGGRIMPSLARVEDVTADGTSIDLEGPREIPASRRRITLSYVGLSLSRPDRVRYSYRLDPFDNEWSTPVADRQAAYTNLAPGTYTFRVKASNSEGLWNGREATVQFTVTPMLRQRGWFQASAVALFGLAVWGIYRVRMMRVAQQLHVRFEERLAERTRIAQELHDTLLQGFLSASMQLHVAAEAVPADSPAKASLGHVLQLMRRVIDEGRNAVRGLRSRDTAGDLQDAFSGIPAELTDLAPIPFRVIVEGQPRPLHPIIRDEMYRIGREAVVNAFRHSAGTQVEVEIEYAPQHIRMLVRDNGRGIDEQVLRTGRDGHWGLSGIRERAQRIGAGIRVWSREGAGTEIELTVPNDVAFRAPKDDSPRHT